MSNSRRRAAARLAGFLAKGGIYLTQVGSGGAAGRQGLSELLRGAAGLVSRRGCLPGLPGVAALAPGVPLPALHRRGWLATEQRSLGVCRLRTPGVGDGRNDLSPQPVSAAA